MPPAMRTLPLDRPKPPEASADGRRGTNAKSTAANTASAAPTHNMLKSTVKSRARTEKREAYRASTARSGAALITPRVAPATQRIRLSASKVRRSARLGAIVKAPIALDSEALLRYSALKAWRAEVAKQHNLPAYVIFHDATLASIAQRAPQSLEDLQGVSGIGAKKLEAYASEVLRVIS